MIAKKITAWRWQAARFITPLTLLAAWQYTTSHGTISTFMLPQPGDVLERIGEHITTGELLINLLVTLRALSSASPSPPLPASRSGLR